jgi:hypothetical protein
MILHTSRGGSLSFAFHQVNLGVRPATCNDRISGQAVHCASSTTTGTPVWTVYTYDPRGRALSVTRPGNAGSTAYQYAGNTVKVIEPVTTRWKKFTLDADGQLTQVEEPGSLFTKSATTPTANLPARPRR